MTDQTVSTSDSEVLAELRRIREANEARAAAPAIEGTIETGPYEVDGFADLDSFFDDHLRLPIRGKVYAVPPASAELGLLCTKLLLAGEQAGKGKVDPGLATELNDTEEQDIYQQLLGHYPNRVDYLPSEDVWLQLQNDGIDYQRITHVGTTAMIWTALGRAAAVDFWLSGARPKAPAAPAPRAPQDRQSAQPPKGSAKSAPRASRAGTTRKAPAKRASAGKKS